MINHPSIPADNPRFVKQPLEATMPDVFVMPPDQPPRPPLLGAIVLYTLTGEDAYLINKRRGAAELYGTNHTQYGQQAHSGNEVAEGDVYPLVITRLVDAPHRYSTPSINGQVLLDGNDSHWVTSVRTYEWITK